MNRPCGLMDEVLVFGTKGCRFESCQGHACSSMMCPRIYLHNSLGIFVPVSSAHVTLSATCHGCQRGCYLHSCVLCTSGIVLEPSHALPYASTPIAVRKVSTRMMRFTCDYPCRTIVASGRIVIIRQEAAIHSRDVLIHVLLRWFEHVHL